jgi:cbb3-type cytochrome oxidase subunit 3
MDLPALLGWLEHYAIVPVLLVFVALVAAAYRPASKQRMERHARIPLDDDR